MTTEAGIETTLPMVEVKEKKLDDYLDIVGAQVIDEIRSLAAPLQGKRILHLNSSPSGGGVADILEALIPLLTDLDLRPEWRVIRGNSVFFDITKKMHNTLQGRPVTWNRGMWNIWLDGNERNAQEMDPDYDVVVVHDPQPAAIPHFLSSQNGKGRAKWLWRCHIDLTDAPSNVWKRLQSYVRKYDGAEFSMSEFIKNGFGGPRTFVSAPAIDPINPKNVPLGRRASAHILAGFGVDPARPIMAQISRFDPWKDPIGVVDVYRQVKTQINELQLVMIGPTAADDPEGWLFFEKTARHAGEDPDVHLLSNFKGAGDLAVNAVQTRADVVVQKSIREGFGLSVTGSLWHGKPVVAGRAGGIQLQVLDGRTGFLIDSTEECAERVLQLLKSPRLSRRLGENAREHVRKNFLITRYLRDSLVQYRQLLENSPVT